MKTKFAFGLLINVIMAVTLIAQDQTTLKTPEEYFGFKPGADRLLFNYGPLISYLQLLDAASPRLQLLEIGRSPLGRNMYIAFISAEENIANLSNLKEMNKRLALDGNIPSDQLQTTAQQGKVFVLATMSMHSTEVAPAQSVPLIAYDLVTTTDSLKLKYLKEVVLMIVPNHNPDGMDMVVNHYNRYKGTKYEGSDMPGVYHKYVGHDNNRDFVTLSQEDSRAIARIYNQDWFPQVMVEKHQMGSTGPRYFVPPMHDPIAENIDAGVWNWTWVFGSNMVKDMTDKGLAGVSQHYLFDDYWPGSTETCIWKNVIGLLTECASVKDATPIYVEPTELNATGKGLAEYKKSINMSLPWPGGWWRLGDMIQYEIESMLSIVKTAALHRQEILQFRNELCRREIEKGKTEPPNYYALPLKQHDRSELVALVNLLREHGVRVYQKNAASNIGGVPYQPGDIVIPLAQPFRAFIKEVLETQTFPVRHYTPNSEIIKPYDIASWSLPLHRGVKAIAVNEHLPELDAGLIPIEKQFDLKAEMPADFWAAVFTVNHNESFKAAFRALELGLKVQRLQEVTTFTDEKAPDGSFIIYHSKTQRPQLETLFSELTVQPLFVQKEADVKATALQLPRIGLVETYFHDMDAGWTRFVFDSYHVPYKTLRPGDFEKTDLAKDYDVLIFPDVQKSILMDGKYQGREKDQYFLSEYPPEYSKGIGKAGLEKLMLFSERGGTIVSWGESVQLFLQTLEIKHGKDKIESFQLPVRDISAKLKEAGFYCPGSFARVDLLKDHPLTLGMESSIGIFFNGSPVFTTAIPNYDLDRRVIATFPEKGILLSGYAEKEDKVGNKAAMVWARKGKGQFVLMSFNPQFRASTQVSFKLIFNALLLPQIPDSHFY